MRAFERSESVRYVVRDVVPLVCVSGARSVAAFGQALHVNGKSI